MKTLLAFAHQLADAARVETLSAANAALVEDKGAERFDPVTEADRAAERSMRERILARFPDHGVVGEEYGATNPHARFVWSLDPIDGTRQLVCGFPMWTTLIGLLDGGRPVLGLIDAPLLGQRYVGWCEGAELGGEPLAVSGCTRLGEARLSTTDPFLFGDDEMTAFDRVRRAARLTRFGGDAFAYARLAAGSIDLVVESGLKPHDIHALVPVVTGAGGVIGNWSGGGDLSAGAVVAAASRELFEEAVELLGS